MSSLRIQNAWSTQTASNGNWLSGQSLCGLSFWVRLNRAMSGGTILQTAGGSVLNIFLNGPNTLEFGIWTPTQFIGNTAVLNVGQWYHVGLSFNSSGQAKWYLEGSVNYSAAPGSSTWTQSGPVTIGPGMSGADFMLVQAGFWNAYAPTAGDMTNLATGVSTPATLGTPATWYWTLAGTANATANPSSDAGFIDQIGGSIHFGAPSGSGSGVYSPDTPALPATGMVLDAYMAEPGNLFAVVLGRPSLGFQMVGNSGQATYQVASIRKTSGGSNYTNPTATLAGGTPTRPAVLGTPIVVAGAIVGIPVHDGGDGYLGTDSLSVHITDPTGSGAAFAITLGGLPVPPSALSGVQPTINVNGTAATLNSSTTVSGNAFWTEHSHDLPVVFYQVKTALNTGDPSQPAVLPSDVITWSAPSGWASFGAGPLPAVPSNTPAGNYTGVIEPAFHLPASGLSMLAGVNVGAIPAANYTPFQVQANRAKNSYVSSGRSAPDGALTTWNGTSATIECCRVDVNFNPIDTQDGNNLGIPFLPGPNLTPSGGGSGAVLIPIISGGVITSIFVAAGGSSFPNSGAVAITNGGGWNATATFTAVGGIIQSCVVTSGGGGYSDGLWKLGYADSAPSTPTIAVLNDVSFNVHFYDLSTYTGLPPALSSLISGGPGSTNVSRAYYTSVRSASLPMGPEVIITVTGGFVDTNSVHYNGAGSSFVVAPPNCSLAQAAGVQPDPNMVAWGTFPDGKYIGVARFMDAEMGFGGDFWNVDYSTLPQPGNFSWNGLSGPNAPNPQSPGVATITITGARPYNLTNSPKVYVDGAHPGAVATGTTPPYAWSPATLSWAGGSGSTAIEFITTTSGLKTGHFPELGDFVFTQTQQAGPFKFLAQNGQSGGVANAPVPIDLHGLQTYVWVTSPTTFVMLFTPGLSGAGLPAQQGTAYCTQSTTNNSVNWISTTAGGSGFVGSSNPPVVSVAQPAGAWQTATAKVVISGGVPQSPVTILSGGNNYSVTPTARIVDPNGNGSGCILSVTMSGGVVTGITASGGSGYSAYCGVQIDPPGITATATPTITSGGVASIALTTPGNGGTGYTGGAPEVIISGDGTGAAAHAVLTGTTVSSIVVDSAGTSYTTNHTSVAIAPPPNQATAFVNGTSAGSLQVFNINQGQYGQISMMAPGFGYGTTPPAVTISGGGGSGATATALLTYPFKAFLTNPAPGVIAHEAAISLVNEWLGCNYWPNMGMFGTDACAQSIASTIATNLAPGRKIYWETGNEQWNVTSEYNFNTVTGRLASPNLDPYTSGHARSAAVHDAVESTLAAVGRGGDLVRVFGSQFSGVFNTQALITYANPNATKVGAVAVAPYIDSPLSFGDGGFDSSWRVAAASVAHSISYSTQYNTAWPWSMLMYHCIWRHHCNYSMAYNGTGLYGQSQGFLAAHQAVLSTYTAGPIPSLVAYEGGIERAIPPGGIGTSGTQPDGRTNGATLERALEHDFFFHPRMKTLIEVWHRMCARGGITATCYFELVGMIQGDGQLWTLVTNAGMQDGLGDGSDGKTINKTWLATGKSQFLNNVAPALAGLKSFGAVSNPLPPIDPSNPSASDRATFTATAFQHRVSRPSAATSATFSSVASSVSRHAFSCLATGSALFHDAASTTSGRHVVVTTSATFSSVASSSSLHHFSVNTSSTALFSDAASRTHIGSASASSRATFSGLASTGAVHVWHVTAVGAAVFTDRSASTDLRTRSSSASTSAVFTGSAASVARHSFVTSTRSAALFTDLASEHNQRGSTVVGAAASSSAVFTAHASQAAHRVYAGSSHDTFVFSVLAMGGRKNHGLAGDRAHFFDRSTRKRLASSAAVTSAVFTDVAIRDHAYPVGAADYFNFWEVAQGGLSGVAADSFKFTDLASMSFYFGRHRLGDSVGLHFNAFTVPDFAPVAVVVNGNQVDVASFPVPTLDPNALYYASPLFLSTLYSLGNFQVYFYFTVGGTPHSMHGSFDVVAGGDPGGKVISLNSIDRPEARSVLAQLSSGRLVVGLSPTL